MNRPRIQHLDGFRGLAILLVVFYHAYARWPDHLGFVADTEEFFIFKYGYLGVQLFFMISGFVIFMSLDKSSGVIEFMKKRWLRLFPAMLLASVLVYLSAGFFIERPAGEPNVFNLIPGLTFIHPSIVSKIFSMEIAGLEGAFWSLYIEMMFYIISCVVYFTLGRKYLLKTIFVSFMASYSLLFFAKISGLEIAALNSLSTLFLIIGFNYYGWFFVGCYLYEKISDRTSKLDFLMLAVVVSCSLSIAYKDPVEMLFMAFCIALFSYSFYSETIKTIFTARIFTFFGLISYPLYLIHENILVSSSIKIIALDVMPAYLTPIIPMLLLSIVAYGMIKIEPSLRDALVKKYYFRHAPNH